MTIKGIVYYVPKTMKLKYSCIGVQNSKIGLDMFEFSAIIYPEREIN